MREAIVLPHNSVMGSEMILPDQRNWGEYQRFLDAKRFTPVTSGLPSIPPLNSATATPAPNDHMELGNHAEFLGVMKATGS